MGDRGSVLFSSNVGGMMCKGINEEHILHYFSDALICGSIVGEYLLDALVRPIFSS